MGVYTLILADDHAMFREGIRQIIERIEDLAITGEAGDGLELLQLLKNSVPDLVILDLSMPNLRGLEAIREIKANYPQVKILVLTMHKKKEFIRQALRDGADGFLFKDDAGDELIRAIKTMREGEKYLSPLLSGMLTSLFSENEKKESLTQREKQVLKLLAEGKKSREIAELLFISIKTVQRHRDNIMGKLPAKTLADLVKYAISENYIAPELSEEK
jgi:DNA-binding NarL/FixJ family response regulator